MREGDRLGPLEVRIPGHDRVDLFGRALGERSREVEDAGVEPRERVDREEPEVQSDLVVAASTRVQLPADLADQVSEATLDDRVNVLEVGRPRRSTLLHLADDARKTVLDGPGRLF